MVSFPPARLPRIYAILDAAWFSSGELLLAAARGLADGGITLMQYRNKTDDAARVLAMAKELRRLLGDGIQLIMNDRADLCVAAGFDGVHVGQDDLSAESVRRIIGPTLMLGVSTHNLEQVRAADAMSADYLAIGPVFATFSKRNPDAVVGLEGVRGARVLTRKPLVAIGGITRENCRAVIDAGADAVAVISDLSLEPRKSAEEFLRILR